MTHAGIGVAGCGRMGAGMLGGLIDAGLDAVGFDVRAVATFGDIRAHVTNDINAFANQIETLVTVVRDSAQTEELLFSEQNLVVRAKHLNLIVICSTLSPKYVRELRDRIPSHISLVDAPMSGAQIAADGHSLSFMLGGAQADIDRLQPALASMGTSFHHMGAFGSGMAAKVLNNLLAASNTVMTRLVLDWAQTQGLDRPQLLALIAASSGQNWFASGFNEIEFSRDGFAPDNTIGILKKDVQSALDDHPPDADTRLPELLIQLLDQLRADTVNIIA